MATESNKILSIEHTLDGFIDFSRNSILKTPISSYLNADFAGLWRCNLNLLNAQCLVGFPRNGRFANDCLNSKLKTNYSLLKIVLFPLTLTDLLAKYFQNI